MHEHIMHRLSNADNVCIPAQMIGHVATVHGWDDCLAEIRK